MQIKSAIIVRGEFPAPLSILFPCNCGLLSPYGVEKCYQRKWFARRGFYLHQHQRVINDPSCYRLNFSHMHRIGPCTHSLTCTAESAITRRQEMVWVYSVQDRAGLSPELDGGVVLILFLVAPCRMIGIFSDLRPFFATPSACSV